jgi:hypothetical protein
MCFLARLFLILSLNLLISLAYADQCESYVGKKLAISSFEEVIKKFDNLSPKTEFETNADFSARRKNSLDGVLGEELIILRNIPEAEKKYIEYDAEKKQFKIIRFIFNNRAAPIEKIFKKMNLNFPRNPLNKYVDNVIIASSDKRIGEYEASNAMGARVTVGKLHRQTHVIFDGAILFSQAQTPPYVLGFLKMEPQDARVFKETVRLAFVVNLKDPFFITGTHRATDPSFSYPYEIDEEISILFASIQCGLIVDQQGTSLAAFKAIR